MSVVVNKICDLFFIFTVFSFAGWVMETLLYLLRDKKAVKRGFLFGPVCPIYGCAAVICDLTLYGRINNIFLIFVIGFFMSGVLEYLTHFAMEKMFHAMWWDYSGRKFNLNGRIYLNGLLIFAAGVVLIVKLLLPLMYKLINLIPNTALYIVCFIVYSVMIVDLATTIVDLKDVIKTLKNFQATAVEEAQKSVDLTTEQIETIKNTIQDSEMYKKTISENPVMLRFKERHPNVKLTKYKFLYDIIMNVPDESKERKDIKLYGTAETVPKKEDENENDE